ncbi:hypothetical protein V1508DRAFT_252784 [Lipomyces doorenjongii]|uniref:uncharacterized protein n=1 Tax=Lipomyces doorenjongii TaxID=383834 RepID=UPI0034CE4F98
MTYNLRKRKNSWMAVMLAICLVFFLVVGSYTSKSHVRTLAVSIVDNGRHHRQSVLEEPKWNGSPETRAVDDDIREEYLNGSPLVRHRKTVAKQLQSCSQPFHKPGGANILINVVNPEGTISRVSFAQLGFIPTDVYRFNPNLIPAPPGSQYPYIGFARESLKPVEDAPSVRRHTVIYCDMDWAMSDTFDQQMLRCVNEPKTLDLPSWRSPTGSCGLWSMSESGVGHIDSRIFMSPRGEPLMVVGTNGIANCVHQFVVDLRTIVPDLESKLKVENVPIRFANLTALPRESPLAEIEKNYLLLFDEKDDIFVHHEIGDRSFTAMSDVGMRNLGVYAPTPECILTLRKTFAQPDSQKMMIHQATNSLRVTLCEYPCEPTLDNTVLISIMHVKYERFLDVYYRRYLVVMNATAPFHILARSSNLMYAGTDERHMVYSVALEWDHSHYRRRRESLDNPPNAVEKREESSLAKLTPDTNNLVNDYYHGWLDDTVLISLGLNDKESAFIHVKASQLLDCLELCPK